MCEHFHNCEYVWRLHAFQENAFHTHTLHICEQHQAWVEQSNKAGPNSKKRLRLQCRVSFCSSCASKNMKKTPYTFFTRSHSHVIRGFLSFGNSGASDLQQRILKPFRIPPRRVWTSANWNLGFKDHDVKTTGPSLHTMDWSEHLCFFHALSYEI